LRNAVRYTDGMDEKPAQSEDAASIEARIKAVCGTLEAVAKSFPPDSQEALAIRDAGLAYALVQWNENLSATYEYLARTLGGASIDEVKADLQRHGIDPGTIDLGGKDG
jgi:hypothetical protein